MAKQGIPLNSLVFQPFFLLILFNTLITFGIHQNTASPPPYLLFGQSCSLTGANQANGIQLSTGIQAAFQELNNAGTLPTRLLLQTLDDQYVPGLAYNNTEYFVQNGSFFATLGSLGTPTAALAWPVAKAAGLPFIGAVTGTMTLRSPFEPDIINLRSSYNDETATMVKYMVNTLLMERISIFYQNDSFGESGLSGLMQAMNRVNLNIYTSGTYERNTLDVEKGMGLVLNVHPPPQAIVMIGTYAPLTKFVMLCKNSLGFDPTTKFFTLSVVNSETLLFNLGANYSSNVIITQVLPLPRGNTYPIISKFQTAMSNFNSSVPATLIAFEGYVLGRFVGMVINRMQNNLTRSHFIETIFDSSLFRLDGLILGPYFYDINYNPYAISLEQNGCNQGMKKVWVTAYDSTLGELVEIDEAALDFYPSCFVDVSTFSSPFIFASISSDVDKGNRFERGVTLAWSGSLGSEMLSGVEVNVFQLTLPPNTQPQSWVQNTIWYNKLIGYLGNEGDIVDNWSFIMEEIANGKAFIGTQTGEMNYRSPYHSLIINLRSSIKDEMYALVHYLIGTMGLRKLVLVTDTSAEAAEAEQVLLNELQAANINIQKVVQVQENNHTLDIYYSTYNIESPPDAVIFVGATAVIKNVSMVLAHHNVWRVYTSLNSMEEVQNMTTPGFNRILFSAPLPNTIGNQNLPIVSSFISDHLLQYPNDSAGLIDPLVFEGYIQGMFIANMISMMALNMNKLNISGISFSQHLTAVRTVDLYGIEFGPYSNSTCSNSTASIDSDCECNQGMRSVFIYSINTSTPEVYQATRFDFGTCGVLLSPVITTWDYSTTVTNIGLTAFIVGLIGWAFLAKTFIFR